MKKILVRIASMVLIVCCMGINVCSAVVEPAVPLWDNIDMVSCEISFTGTKGIVLCLVTAVSGTDSIEGTLKLYEDNVEIECWNIDANTSYVNILDEFYGTKGCTYELVLDVDVIVNGRSETLEVTAEKYCK